jgi:hypothetical protein
LFWVDVFCDTGSTDCTLKARRDGHSNANLCARVAALRHVLRCVTCLSMFAWYCIAECTSSERAVPSVHQRNRSCSLSLQTRSPRFPPPVASTGRWCVIVHAMRCHAHGWDLAASPPASKRGSAGDRAHRAAANDGRWRSFGALAAPLLHAASRPLHARRHGARSLLRACCSRSCSLCSASRGLDGADRRADAGGAAGRCARADGENRGKRARQAPQVVVFHASYSLQPKTKEAGTQSLYRESAAQTDPWSADYLTDPEQAEPEVRPRAI